ncbi:transaldolase family protein [Palleronia sp. LCG004]|uniref:transaldolase family protein n=1 Tax=Palleronia sp. LCG004 TaxID=3079304 RepID=UPI002942897F|nr:transaldolase family protein [Palleronia sp. LCG004]WOI56415.1 transaldolase family protein [Palleronia sp. LCG004]
MGLDLYLDTADRTEWDALLPTGLFTGITTNPLLAQRAGLRYPEIDWGTLADHAAGLGAREFHAQVAGPVEGYVDFARTLYRVGKDAGIRTVVKIPLTEDGIRATPAIRDLDGPILMTACYDPKQMFVATALGAEYIAPYFGRMLEAGMPAYDAMSEMRAIGLSAGGKTRVLIASLRNARQMVELAARGQDCFTIAPAVARELLSDDRTLAAAAQFEEAAAS